MNLARSRKPLAYYLTLPVVRLLARTGVTPTALTWLGLMLALAGAVLIGTDHLFIAGFVVLIAGYFDILDGALARHTGQVSIFGGVLDSVFDRLFEGALLVGILVRYTIEPTPLMVLLAGLALLGSLLVSYIRSRAEAAGLKCEVGIFTRAERVLVLILGLWLSQIPYALAASLTVIVVFSFITVGQRLYYVWQQTRTK
ncbi:MAG: CDP-alcohol phosphatidyltransferase family protein [Chloroflexota bacterium]